MKVFYIAKAIAAFSAGRIGDVAAYKGLIIDARPRAELQLALSQLADPLPAIDLVQLRKLEKGSFGRIYADHMDDCGLTPLQFSAQCRADLKGKPLLSPRYTLFHDVFHVLLDQDTSLAGECVVWSFVSGQQYSSAFDKAGTISVICYSLAKPWKRRLFAKAYRQGLAQGRNAASVLAAPLETFWALPLAQVRRQLAITPT